MENPPFGESIVDICYFFGGPLRKSKIATSQCLHEATGWGAEAARQLDFFHGDALESRV
jgi:hypothetical protein